MPETGPRPGRPAEPVFEWSLDEPAREMLHPIRYPDILDFRNRIEAVHWLWDEVDLRGDAADWARLSEAEREFVRHNLGFFVIADREVIANIGENFAAEVDCLEAQFVYAAQLNQETTHQVSYEVQVRAVMGGAELERVLGAVRTMPEIAALRAWARERFARARPLGERLVAAAAVEGVLFCSSFAALQWLRNTNRLPGITMYNSFIARDEALHTEFTSLIVRKYLRARPTAERAHEIFGAAVAALDDFVGAALPAPLLDMSADRMRRYVRFQADFVLRGMGYPPMFGDANPFGFMENLGLDLVRKINFFEKRSSQYEAVSDGAHVRFSLGDEPDEDAPPAAPPQAAPPPAAPPQAAPPPAAPPQAAPPPAASPPAAPA